MIRKKEKRPLELKLMPDESTIIFHSAKDIWITYGAFLRCLKLIERESEKPAPVTLDFRNLTGSVYPATILSLAGLIDYYREKQGWAFTFLAPEKDYLSATHFLEPLSIEGHKKNLHRKIFDKAIRFENHAEAAFISQNIYHQLMRIAICEPGVLAGLGWCVNEVMDNVLTHAGTERGYFMAQVHPHKKVINISVFDLGCGLLTSLNRSGRFRVENELAAIELATQKGVTEDKNIGQGNGLYGLRRIVEHNQSHFSILTGRTSIAYDFEKQKVTQKTKNPIIDLETRGTRVDFTINYQSRIDLRTALDGYQTYEDLDKDIEEMEQGDATLLFAISKRSGKDYGSRASGKRLRTELINFMKSYDGRIVLDFQGVPIIDSSFADEFLGRLVADIGLLNFNHRFILAHTNPDVAVILERAISMRVRDLFDS